MKPKPLTVAEAGRKGGKASAAALTPEQRVARAKKAVAVREERRLAGWPPKIHTLKTPCLQPGCKITNGHEHTV